MVKVIAEYLKLPAFDLGTEDNVHSALTNMGVVPAVFCVFMLCALITARVGPFARMTKLEVTNRVQGYAIWWIMKHFLIAAAEKGVRIPGLETEPLNGSGPSQCAAMLITANMKLEQFDHLFAAARIPPPNMLDIYFQTTPDTASEADKEEDALDFEAGSVKDDEEEAEGDFEE